MNKTPKRSQKLLQFLLPCGQGMLVGTGAILPGISGGVLCVAFGIYEPMMALLAHPVKGFRTYYRLFIPFGIGGAIGFVLLANAVELLFDAAASVALMLFAGLIFGTVPDLMKTSQERGPKQSWSPLVLSLAAIYLLFQLLNQGSGFSIEPNALWYVFCGLVWGLSLVIPGLSSSSLLIFMGLYQPMTAGIAALDFGVILPLVAGMLVTILLTARLVNWLFEQKYALMSRLVIGVMIASTLMILPTSFESTAALVGSILCFIAGFALARWMDTCRTGQESDDGGTLQE